jgi:hypothetical protein
VAIWGTANDPSFVGNRLATLRGQRHLTPKDQADALGLTLLGLADLCLGRTPKDRGDVARIAARMGWESGRVADLLGVRLPM